MADFDSILATKKEAQARLRALPGVHAVAIGPKIVGGKSTAEPAILVFLVQKKPLSAIPPDEVIPTEINGVKTDVIEEDVPKLHETAEGGLQIGVGGFNPWYLGTTQSGTLGCIAISKDKSKVFAITCHHVVATGDAGTSTLTVTPSTLDGDGIMGFGGTITSGSLVYVNFTPVPTNGQPEYGAYYAVTASDTLDSVASGVAKAINNMGVSGFSALANFESVTITQGNNHVCRCSITGPTQSPSSGLDVSIAGNQITFTGQVSGDYYGAYTSLNVGGLVPSFGVFTPIPRSTSLNAVAALVAASITSAVSALSSTSPGWGLLGGVNATSSEATVAIIGAEEVDCQTTGDVRVGQPCVCSVCSSCCGPRIGIVAAARLDLDAAMIQLDAGLQYLAEINGITDTLNQGVVTGAYPVLPQDIPYLVKKSGARTGFTTGKVTALNRDGYLDHPGPFQRQYAGAMVIKPTSSTTFSAPGDSGSAVLNSANQVVGILFGGGSSTGSDLATPIQSITDAFEVDVATAQAADAVQTVPGAAAAPGQPATALARTVVRPPISASLSISSPLREAQQEIMATEVGREYAAVVRRHAAEVQTLINTNKRVGTVWQRSGGPQMIQALLRVLQRPDQALPVEIDGKPLTDCIAKIQEVLMRYASPDLAAGLSEFAPRLANVGGLNYAQLLAALQAPKSE